MSEQAHHNNAAPAVNTEWLAGLISEVGQERVADAARGLCTLLSMCNCLADQKSDATAILGRVALLAKAAWLPEDAGFVNGPAMQFLMGISDDTVRRMVNNMGVPKIEPSGRGSSMYRPDDFARSHINDAPARTDEAAN